MKYGKILLNMGIKMYKVCYLEVKLKEGDVKEMLRLSAVLLCYNVEVNPNPKLSQAYAKPTPSLSQAYPKPTLSLSQA